MVIFAMKMGRLTIMQEEKVNKVTSFWDTHVGKWDPFPYYGGRMMNFNFLEKVLLGVLIFTLISACLALNYVVWFKFFGI